MEIDSKRKIIFGLVIFIFSILLSVIGIFVIKKIHSDSNAQNQPIINNVEKSIKKTKVIGKSVLGRNIELYSYGSGSKHILFVGGIHGGYEWNSVLLAYKMVDYFDQYYESIPKNLSIDIIPSLNPDGVYKVTNKVGRFTIDDVSTDEKVLESGRFNANNVDINRNFDCNWQEKSSWRSKEVSAGTKPFSEPESKIFKELVIEMKPEAVIFWHSQSNGVYGSQCGEGLLPKTIDLMNIYSDASGYSAIKEFDAYPVTGAAEDWLASIKIPAVTVELKTHESIEFEKNIEGVKAVIEKYLK